MKMDVYLKSHPDGTPWKWWAIGEESSNLYVRFGSYGLKDSTGSRNRIQSVKKLEVIKSIPHEIDIRTTGKLSEGYNYQGAANVEDDGVLMPFIEPTKPNKVSDNVLLYIAGEVASASNFSSLMLEDFKALSLPISLKYLVESNAMKIALEQDGFSVFEISVLLSGVKGKVTSTYTDKHSPYVGLFLLFLNKYITDKKLGTLEFSDSDAKEIVMSAILKQEVLDKFNPLKVENFKGLASEIGVIRKPMNFSNLAPNYSNQTYF